MASWFRRTLLRGPQAAEEAPAPDARVEEEQAAKEAPSQPDGSEATERPRRRGSRSGGGRRKVAAEETEEVAPSAGAPEAEPAAAAKAPARRRTAAKTAGEKPAARGSTTPKAGPQKAEAPRRRRSETPRRSSLPAVRKQMLVSVDVCEQRVAVLEDGQVVEVYLERPGRRSIAGNIYKGVVDNVLPGMEASFVDIGLEKNGFLYVDEIVVPELEGRRHGRRIQDIISRGQEVLVQATKDPMGTKGARLTTEVSLAGRFLVYTPFGDGIGVSRRLEDAERERLKGICRGLELPDGGIIVRTAAEGASEAELAGDLAFLQKLWATIQGRASRATAPSLVYREAELPLRVVRDLFTADFTALAVDHERTYRRIVSYLKRTSPELASKVALHRTADRLMETHGVDAAVRSTLERRVDLPSGGYLVFDYAEAFTVIDVNTGRFVGARGKSSGARLEDTITKNNLEAAKEIVRQLRLRDIGGIIVIDFIDMANPKNRHEVEEALRLELERDRTKTYVVEISPLGLVEMTRQNVTEGPREILTMRCPVCEGNGVVVSEETYAVEAERKLRRLAEDSPAEALQVEVAPGVAGILIGPAGSRLAELERETGKLLAFETRDGLPPDHFRLLREGTVGEIEPEALPVAAGQELELTLVERHLRHPEDAIARLDGYLVAVAGAGARVGETVRARIERATRTAAYAVLVAQPEIEAPVEAGTLAESAEAEAPRPPRPRARRGGGRAKAAAERMGEEEAPETEPVEAAGGSAEGEAPRKKTRRGTRGGRGRKKPAAAVPVAGVDPDFAAEAHVGPQRASGEADAGVPELGQAPEPAGAGAGGEEPGGAGDGERVEGDAPTTKTRRGTRGGRGRKKPAAAVPVAGVDPDFAAEAHVGPQRASAEAEAGVSGLGQGSEPVAAVAVEDGSLEAEPVEAAGGSAEGEAPRKKTRRGTRGGRGRKRPAAAALAAASVEPDFAAEAHVGPQRASAGAAARVPAGLEADADGDRPRRRTRRGARGSRGRRPVGAAAMHGARDEGASEEAAAVAGDELE